MAAMCCPTSFSIDASKNVHLVQPDGSAILASKEADSPRPFSPHHFSSAQVELGVLRLSAFIYGIKRSANKGAKILSISSLPLANN